MNNIQILPPAVVRILTFVSGVLAILLGAIDQLGLPTSVRNTAIGVGGVILLLLAFLEHPTVVARVGGLGLRVRQRPSQPPAQLTPQQAANTRPSPATAAPGMANPQ